MDFYVNGIWNFLFSIFNGIWNFLFPIFKRKVEIFQKKRFQMQNQKPLEILVSKKLVIEILEWIFCFIDFY